MARTNKHYSPVITCGAASVSLDGELGETTSIDLMVNAVRRLLKKRNTPNGVAEASVAQTSASKQPLPSIQQ